MIDIDLSGDDKDTGAPDLGDSAPDDSAPLDTVVDTNTGECTTAPEAAGGTIAAEACSDSTIPTPVTDPWKARLLWRVATPGGNLDATKGPVIAQTDDDNGDGSIDTLDHPEIAVAGTNVNTAAYQSGAEPAAEWIAVLDGATGTERWSWRSTSEGVTGLAFGDVDGEPGAELIVDGTSEVVAYAADGTPVWSVPRPSPAGWPTESVALADVYGDGTLDVVTAGAILDGATGATLLELPAGGYPNTFGLRVLDLDQDGQNEVIRGADLLGLDGSITRLGAPSALVAWTLPVQDDTDAAAELAVVSESDVEVYDDGVMVRDYGFPAGRFGYGMLPCAADLDVDGRTDVIVSTADGPGRAYATAYDADGDELWDVQIATDSIAGSCSVADLDQDGAVEVIVQAAGGVLVLDGLTGAILLQLSDTGSHAQFSEVPALADVDGDGAAELVLAENDDALDTSGHTGLAVFEHDGAGWGPASTAWGWLSWTDGDADDLLTDGTPQATWLTPGVYRGYGPAGAAVTELPLLSVDTVGLCADTCDEGHASFSVQVSNPSTVDAVGTLEVWDGTTLLATTDLGTIPAGTSLDSLTFEVGATTGTITVVVHTEDACGGADATLVIPAICGS